MAEKIFLIGDGLGETCTKLCLASVKAAILVNSAAIEQKVACLPSLRLGCHIFD
jgi:hypothetical protein